MEEMRIKIDQMNQAEGPAAGQYHRLDPKGWSDIVPRVANPPRKRTNNAENQRHQVRLQKGKGRAGGQNLTNTIIPPVDPATQRILSQGERIDGPRKAARKCLKCWKTGHDFRKCPEGADERARQAAINQASQEVNSYIVITI
jgi:hypothetical protein